MAAKKKRKAARRAPGPTPHAPVQAHAFKHGDKVVITRSLERGVVDGICTYRHTPTRYFLQYRDTGGKAVSDWFGAEELSLDV